MGRVVPSWAPSESLQPLLVVLLMAIFSLCLRMVFPCVWVLISSSYKDTCHMGLTSLLPLQRPHSK